MAVAQGYGKTVTSGSVFAFDVADTRNSYKGEPTTNVATGTLTPYTPYNTMTRSGQNLTITMVGGSALYLTFHNGTDYNGQTITLSGYMFKNGTPHTLPNNRANTYHTVAASKWYFDSVTGYFEIVEVCNASSIWLFHTPSGASGGDVITILDFQVEVKTHATPFINGTRPATQGLLPIVGNSTIDLSNMSFDSNAQMTFDGTNDYISITNTPTIVPTSNTSWEFILKLTSTSGYRALFQKSNYSNSTGFIALFMNPGSLTFRINASDVAESTRALDHYFSGNITLNVYTHVVLTYNGVVFTLYINGVPTDTVAWSYGLGTNQGDMYVGNFWAGYWPGEIPITKQYNITLSAAEVRQNYLHYKTRFNLS